MVRLKRTWKRNKLLSFQAFTLIETCITLFIFCLIFTIPTINLKGYQNTVKVHNTRRQVKAIIENYSRYALLKNKAYWLTYNPDSHTISASSGNEFKEYSIDKDVVVKDMKIIKINSSGRFTPRTIVFVCHDKKQQVNLQMMWGRMIDE